MTPHRGIVRSFPSLGAYEPRRWLARCSCSGVIVTAGSWQDACRLWLAHRDEHDVRSKSGKSVSQIVETGGGPLFADAQIRNLRGTHVQMVVAMSEATHTPKEGNL